MLMAVSREVPELYPLCYAAYSSASFLKFGAHTVLSQEGVQQGDPLGPLLFCLTLQPVLNSLQCKLKLGYLEDVTLGGSFQTVADAVALLKSSGEAIGLHLPA